MAVRSRHQGGFFKFYQEGLDNAEKIVGQRGYYFIENDSLFPDHKLPDDFRLETDDPTQPIEIEFPEDSTLLAELTDLQRQFEFHIVFVPIYARSSQAAPPSPKPAWEEFLERQGITVVDPQYFVYPNRLFSDVVHVNPEGAERYTRDLWDVLSEAAVFKPVTK